MDKKCEMCGVIPLTCICHGGMAPGALCTCQPCKCGIFKIEYGSDMSDSPIDPREIAIKRICDELAALSFSDMGPYWLIQFAQAWNGIENFSRLLQKERHGGVNHRSTWPYGSNGEEA